MNLPNSITLGRLAVTAAAFVCLELIPDPNQPAGALAWWAFGLFLFAAGTDFVDGYLARKFGQVTLLGRIADPFADKVLVCGTLVLLLDFAPARGDWLLTGWFVVVVLAREFLVTSLRGLAESRGIPFPADWLGKWKMVAQCWTCAALLSLVAGTELFYECAVAGVWIALLLTVVSGLNYLVKARRLFRGEGAS